MKTKKILLSSLVIFSFSVFASFAPLSLPLNNPNLWTDLPDGGFLTSIAIFITWLLVVILKKMFKKKPAIHKIAFWLMTPFILLLPILTIYLVFFSTQILSTTHKPVDVCKVCKYSEGDYIAYYDDSKNAHIGQITKIADDKYTVLPIMDDLEKATEDIQIDKKYISGKATRPRLGIDNMKPEELENYKQTYQDPYVIYLRQALDAYLAGTPELANISPAAVEKNVIAGLTSGLDSFDKEYYKSKFIVLTISDGILGGQNIQIIFQDRPDQVFYAWTYKATIEGRETYELRGFSARDNITPEQMQEMVEVYSDLIFHKELSI